MSRCYFLFIQQFSRSTTFITTMAVPQRQSLLGMCQERALGPATREPAKLFKNVKAFHLQLKIESCALCMLADSF